jgi:heme exporter protein D
MDLNDLGSFDWHALLVLNGDGRFVWPAYGVTLIVLVALTVQSVRSLRRRRAALEALLPSERRGRRGAERKPAEPRLGTQHPAPGPRPERPA